MESEMPTESSTGENQLDSTPPAGIFDISGQDESAENMKTQCHQTESFVDAEKSIISNERSDAQEQSSTSLSEKIDSFQRSLFEPKEKSTPKSAEKRASEEKSKPSGARTGHAVSDR